MIEVLGWVILLVPVGIFLLMGIRYVIRGTPVQRLRAATRSDEGPPVDDEEFPTTLELLTRVDLVPGNDAEVFICGDETYPRLWDDLRRATRSITLQMYYANPGRIADTTQQILIERARAGVKVLFLRDAFGAGKLSREYFDALRAAGVEVATFRPIEWYSIERAYARSHIRVVVIDAEVAYTGGFGLDDKWLGNGRTPEQWRDSTVRFTGPSVAQLQATFAAGWADATGQLITGSLFFPYDPENGGEADGPGSDGMRASVLHAAPTIGSTPAERFLALTIGGACERLWISNAYFVPDLDFVGMLTHAAERGADVRILVPSQVTDSKTVFFAGRQTYGALLEGGVRIFEYMPTMMHAKTFVADRCFAGVGTMNFDNRSMAFNDESMFLAYDRKFNARLAAIFEEDMKFAHEITLQDWRQRPLLERGVSKLTYAMRRIL